MPILEFEGLRAPALLFDGGQDPESRPQERAAVERVLRCAGVPHEIVTFPEAGREFFNDESRDYRIAAAREARERSLAFLRNTLSRLPAGG
jgi:dienelactone hydrolase